MNYLLLFLSAYCIGCFPTALIVVKLFTGHDVRESGSGNMGAMNTMRMVKKYKNTSLAIFAFLIVWFIDMGKAMFALFVVQSFFNLITPLALTLTTVAVILGHNYPIFLKFKGGRGAASFMGILLYLDWPVFFVWNLTIFAGMIITDLFFVLIGKKKISKKIIIEAISEQILGRLIGEILTLIPVYLFYPNLFYPTFFGTLLIIISHYKRLKDQLTFVSH